MIRLGITGGIGCGKSYIAHLLQERGIPVYDTDREAKRLMLSHPAVRKSLIELLGESVYQGSVLNKPLLAGYLFACKDNAERINKIVHPCVYEDFLCWAESHKLSGKNLVAMESAILFESGFNRAVDRVLMVYAPMELRIRRAMERDHASEKQVRSRMAAQADDEEKMKRSDYVITNDGISSLDTQLDCILLALKE